MADETLMDLIDAYAEARHAGGCHTYNDKTAEARAKVLASLAASAPAATAADGKWYMLSRNGMATLCADRDDAMTEAASADKLYPNGAPHRALQLVAANAGSDGVASLSAAEPSTPEFSEAQIASVCMSYRHDFGLLSETDRKSMMWIARQWERAFAKEREWATPSPQAAQQAPRDAERELEMTQQFNAGRQYEAGRIAARVAAAQQAPAGAIEDVDLPDVEDMAHSAVQEALSFGLSHDVIYRWMRAAQDQTVTAMRVAPAMDGAWKDHNTAQLVNELRDVAVEFHGAQQLRERIAHVIVPLTDKLKAGMDGCEDARWFSERDNVLHSFWVLLGEAESQADNNDDRVLKHQVEGFYRQLNALRGSSIVPRWVERAARAAQKEGEKP